MKNRKYCVGMLAAALGVMLAGGCTRALRDGVSIGVTDGLSDGVSQVLSEWIASFPGNDG